MPANGVYAVLVTLPDGTKRSGMLCIGHRPTIETNGEVSVEAHIFDFCGNLYDKTISVDFIAKLRDEKPFVSLDALRQQLTIDANAAKQIIQNQT